MHLVEQYALSCGVKIDRPFVETQFFPLPFKDYVILHPSSGMESKNYDYFTDVLCLILPYFKRNGIEIVQLGGPQDPPIPGCYHVMGQTRLNQAFYLIRDSLLVIGSDCFATHVAGGFNKKVVGLYSNLFSECSRPFWGDTANQRLIQADREGKKPSFSAKEVEKLVNNIKPEEIAIAALDLLEIEHSLGAHETLYIGDKYREPLLEVVPNFTSPDSLPGDRVINLRMDYLHNPEIAMQWAFKHKTHLVLDRELEPKFFNPIRPNLIKVTLQVNKETNPEYIKFLRSLGCPIELFALDDNNLKDIRVKFLDLEIEKLEVFSKESLDNPAKVCDNTCYSSSKTIFSNGKYYGSKASWLSGSELKNTEPIIDNEEFWKEIDYFRVFNTK